MTSVWVRRTTVRARRAWRQLTPPPAEHAGSEEAAGSSINDMLPGLIQFGALVAFFQNYVVASMQCVGPSMLPTLGLSGDVVLMWPTASGHIAPQLGDVVICTSPTDPTATVCKRVAGMPGDVVRYRWRPGMMHSSQALVPPGQCWLHGDNANDSTDSRYYGSVPLALIKGVVFLKLWPLREAGWISRTPPRAEDMAAAARPPPPRVQHDREPPVATQQPRDPERNIHDARASAPAIRPQTPQTPSTPPTPPTLPTTTPTPPTPQAPQAPQTTSQQVKQGAQATSTTPQTPQTPLQPPQQTPTTLDQRAAQMNKPHGERHASEGGGHGAPPPPVIAKGAGMAKGSTSSGTTTTSGSRTRVDEEQDEYSEALAAAAWRARVLREQSPPSQQQQR